MNPSTISLTLYYADGTSETLSGNWPYGDTYQNVVRVTGTTDDNFDIMSADSSWFESFGTSIDHYLTCDSRIYVTLPM